MIRRLRLVLLLARPAALVLFATSAALGVAQAGAADEARRLAVVFAAVFAYVLTNVAVNDLADERIDRINLGNRPLVTGVTTRAELRVIAAVAAGSALAAAALLGSVPLAIMAVGLVVGVGYSVPPVRIADRGIVAALVLPGCYVGVPFLLGYSSVGRSLDAAALLTLAGLYLGFVGRLLLKDFRDVRGDALFGKRTVLVRHGRRTTCCISAVAWTAGTALIVASHPDQAFATAALVLAGVTVVLMARLARSTDRRGDDRLISALAILGRGLLVDLLVELGLTQAGWPMIASAAVLAALTVSTLGAAGTMLRQGPSGRLVLCIGRGSRASSGVPTPASRL